MEGQGHWWTFSPQLILPGNSIINLRGRSLSWFEIQSSWQSGKSITLRPWTWSLFLQYHRIWSYSCGVPHKWECNWQIRDSFPNNVAMRHDCEIHRAFQVTNYPGVFNFKKKEKQYNNLYQLSHWDRKGTRPSDREVLSYGMWSLYIKTHQSSKTATSPTPSSGHRARTREIKNKTDCFQYYS